MSEENEPDWLAELAKGGDEVRRQIELLVQGAQQFVRDNQQAMASGGPVPPLRLRVLRAVGVAIAELAPAAEHPVRQGGFHGYATVVGRFAGTAIRTDDGAVTFSGSVALPAPRVAGQMTVQDRRGPHAGQILALVLLWLVVLAVPVAVMATDLSPEAQAMLDAYDAMLAALAVKITFRILDKRE